MNPGEVTTVIMQFKLPAVPFVVPASLRTGENEYVWHCHILEHEEHDMMRPLVVTGTCPTFGVNPEFQTVIASSVPPLGLKLNYFVFGGTDDFTITASSGAPAPTPNLITTDNGTFSVTVPQGAIPGTYTYTITSGIDTTTATLIIV
jgi:hypothetical protein